MRRALFPLTVFLAVASPLLAARMSLTAYFQQGNDDAAWQKQVMQKAAKAFRAPAEAPAPGKKCVVIATLSRTGKVSGTIVNLSSGSKAWDDAALSAVTRSSPFPPFSKSGPGGSFEVHFHFAVAP